MPQLLHKTCKYIAASALLISPALFAQTASTRPPTTPQIIAQLAPKMAEVVLLYDAIKGTPAIDLTPQDARQQFAAEDAAKLLERGVGTAEAPMPVGKVTDGVTIPGPDGNQIPIRIYTPAGAGPFPVTLYFHGGGFVVATIDTYDASPRALCDYANTIVVSVEYRKAPEAPFPAARRDAIASYQWVLNNIAQYNGISGKVAVIGESAGGNLAAEVAIAARNQGLQNPTAEVLVYPVVSANLSQPSDLLYTDSALPLNTAGLANDLKLYLPISADDTNPDALPINADLHRLPPTTIIAAQFDPLQSDGQAYALKLQQSSVQVNYKLYSGTTHEFFGMGGYVDKAKDAEIFAASALTASFK